MGTSGTTPATTNNTGGTSGSGTPEQASGSASGTLSAQDEQSAKQLLRQAYDAVQNVPIPVNPLRALKPDNEVVDQFITQAVEGNPEASKGIAKINNTLFRPITRVWESIQSTIARAVDGVKHTAVALIPHDGLKQLARQALGLTDTSSVASTGSTPSQTTAQQTQGNTAAPAPTDDSQRLADAGKQAAKQGATPPASDPQPSGTEAKTPLATPVETAAAPQAGKAAG